MKATHSKNPCWWVVVADDETSEWTQATERAGILPVQYLCFGTTTCLVQKALLRASKMVPATQVMVTLLEDYRQFWEPLTWFIPPRNKVVGDHFAVGWLAASAALLAIASKDPTNIVTILPARCFVEYETRLSSALCEAVALLPLVSEGVVTLGMVDTHEAVDEDYLVSRRATYGPGFEILGFARRPISWVAGHLRRQGAMVASGIMVGYAGAFAAHMSKQWPGVTRQLLSRVDTAAVVGTECEVSVGLQRGMPGSVLRSLRWRPPSFAQRAFRVDRCGWSSLKSPQSVNRVKSSCSDSAGQRAETAKSQSRLIASTTRNPWPSHHG